VTLFGSGFGRPSSSVPRQPPRTRTRRNVDYIRRIAAPLLYASATQASRSCRRRSPAGTDGGAGPASGGESAAVTLAFCRASGLFTLDSSGTGLLAAVLEDGTINSPQIQRGAVDRGIMGTGFAGGPVTAAIAAVPPRFSTRRLHPCRDGTLSDQRSDTADAPAGTGSVFSSRTVARRSPGVVIRGGAMRWTRRTGSWNDSERIRGWFAREHRRLPLCAVFPPDAVHWYTRFQLLVTGAILSTEQTGCCATAAEVGGL